MSATPLLVENNARASNLSSRVLFSAALLKVASRCNLDCDYCYVYKHADQSWRNQPRLMSSATLEQFAKRLREYTELHDIHDFAVTFHGGEPLLFGGERLAAAARSIQVTVGPKTSISFSLQTNGTLLTDDVLDQLESANIHVSLSLDGPQHLNDRHRLDHRGRSTFDATFSAIRRLKERQSPIFDGVIAVIDPTIAPRELFEFFSPLSLPRLDLLLPDATHSRQPPGRDVAPDLYTKWLQEAIEVWFQDYSSLPVRWFDALLASRVGVPSATDAMGLGAVSLIVVDTDGGYTDHDVFKITTAGFGNLGCNLENASFDEVANHPSIREHSLRLTLEGLANVCQTCPVVDACGGGSVMHRWHPKLKLSAPSVYCGELFGALETATTLVKDALANTSSPLVNEICLDDSPEDFVRECNRWRQATESRADEVAARLGIQRQPFQSAASILICDRYQLARQDIEFGSPSTAGTWLQRISIQSNDPRLVAPFLNSIRVLPPESVWVRYGIATLGLAMEYLSSLNSRLPDAFASLISDIIFVESTIESPSQIFSFSDDTAPNVLYVCPSVGDDPLGSDDLADSLLHEFLHQVLYHLEHDGPVLLDHVFPRFPAPWRPGLRPSGGFLHGTFVFAGLSRYWAALAATRPLGTREEKARENANRFLRQAEFGIRSLEQFALLTPRGEALLKKLRTMLSLQPSRMTAPSLLASGKLPWRSEELNT